MTTAIVILALALMALAVWRLTRKDGRPPPVRPKPSLPPKPIEPLPEPEPQVPTPEPEPETPRPPHPEPVEPRPRFSTVHVYQEPGDYVATLTLRDAGGHAYQATKQVRI